MPTRQGKCTATGCSSPGVFICFDSRVESQRCSGLRRHCAQLKCQEHMRLVKVSSGGETYYLRVCKECRSTGSKTMVGLGTALGLVLAALALAVLYFASQSAPGDSV